MADDLLLLVAGGSDNLLLTNNDDLLLASSTGVGSANAECATFTFAAQNASASISVSAECATFTFAAQDAQAANPTAPVAENVTFTVTANNATVSVAVPLRLDPATIRVDGQLTVPPRGTRRRIVAVTMDGSPIGEFENARVGPVGWALNEPDSWSFTIPKNDPKASLVLDERFREVQVWRGDQVLTWGPMMRMAQGTDGRLAVEGPDCFGYLSRRNIGKADRTNYIENGSFEDGANFWTIDYESPLEPVANRTYANFTWAISTDRAIKGRRSLRLEQPSATAPEFGIAARQQFVWDVDPAENPDGDTWTVAARCFIPDADWAVAPYQNLGLRLARFSTTETVSITPPGGVATLFPKPIEVVWDRIDDDTPRDVWHTLSTQLVAPVTGESEFVQVLLYCPLEGSIYWDAAVLARDERLAFFAADQATIAAGIVDHLQDTDFDKSDLNIDTNCPATGVLRDRIYLHAEHVNGVRALDELTRLDDGFDHRIVYTPTTRTYTTEFPSSGRWRPKAGLELGRNIASYDWTFDGETAASSVVTLGQGTGSVREEGFASDASTYANDVILEEVFAASPDTPIEHLDSLAAERLTVTLDPEILEVRTIAITNTGADNLLGYVRVGDVVPVTIRDHELNIEGVPYRIVRMSLESDDTLSFTLNKRDAA